MSYKKQNWVDGETPADAEHFNHMEEGIEKASVHIGADAPTDGSLLWVDTNEEGGSGGGGSGGVEPLVGTTDEITPSMVVEALQAGRPILLTHTDEEYGLSEISFSGFGFLASDDGDTGNVLISTPLIMDTNPATSLQLVGADAVDEWQLSFILLGGGSGIDVTAEVGQTIIVKEVDGDGKPTAWEAVDLPSEGLSNQPWELIERVEVAEEGVKNYTANTVLREFKLMVTVPTAESTVAGGMEIYKKSALVAYAYIGTVVNTKSQKIIAESTHSHGESYVEYRTTTTESTPSETRVVTNLKTIVSTDVNEPYTKISIYQNSTGFPIGTTFELWGIE